MWKSAFLFRTATKIYPQGNVETWNVFHRECGRKFQAEVFHRIVFHIPQALLIKKVVCSFLVPARKERKESGLGGLFTKPPP